MSRRINKNKSRKQRTTIKNKKKPTHFKTKQYKQKNNLAHTQRKFWGIYQGETR